MSMSLYSNTERNTLDDGQNNLSYFENVTLFIRGRQLEDTSVCTSMVDLC